MPPRKRTAPREQEDEKTHYHIVVTDGEKNRIRFGPFTADDIENFKPSAFAKDLADDVKNLGLEATLTGLDLWGNLTVQISGDDGSAYPVCEIPLNP